ncbi:MAG TPA: hypothetical protein VLB12_16925 [Gemmatimonadales bacterium]|nr:hypothetical protein [Gemmatimonadales bacterium]
MLEDQVKLAGELREILLRNPSLWPPVDLTAATRGVAASVQIDGGLGLWASDPTGSTKPYRTRRADSKPVYQSPDPAQAAAVATALNEVTWNQVKKAKNFDIDHLAFLADLADSRSLGWLPAGAAKEIRRIADDIAPHIDRILEGQASLRQRALPVNLRRAADRIDAR